MTSRLYRLLLVAVVFAIAATRYVQAAFNLEEYGEHLTKLKLARQRPSVTILPLNGLEMPRVTREGVAPIAELVKDPRNHEDLHSFAVEGLAVDRESIRKDLSERKRALVLNNPVMRYLRGPKLDKHAAAAQEQINSLSELQLAHMKKLDELKRPQPINAKYRGLTLPEMSPKEHLYFESLEKGGAEPRELHGLALHTAAVREEQFRKALTSTHRQLNDPLTDESKREALMLHGQGLRERLLANADVIKRHQRAQEKQPSHPVSLTPRPARDPKEPGPSGEKWE